MGAIYDIAIFKEHSLCNICLFVCLSGHFKKVIRKNLTRKLHLHNAMGAIYDIATCKEHSLYNICLFKWVF